MRLRRLLGMMSKSDQLTLQELNNRYIADFEIGTLRWRISNSNRVKTGDIAGYLSKSDGYIKITFNKKKYQLSRCLWYMYTGSWPIGEIDHIDGVRTNNSISNLRDVTLERNRANRTVSLGEFPLGVSKAKGKRNPYRARITVGGKEISLGAFQTIEEASSAYRKARFKLR